MRARFRFLPQVALVAVLALALAIPIASGAGAPVAADPRYAGVTRSQVAAIQAETIGTLSTYRLNADFTPASGATMARIDGTLDLAYMNATGIAQSAMHLRLYPNSAIYSSGGMEISDLVIDGRPEQAALSARRTVLTVPLATPLAPGGSVNVHLSFRTEVPTDPSGTYGMFEYDSATSVYTLANWFPILAGYDPVSGWLVDPPAVIGDPVFANAALFDALVTAPSDIIVAAGGAEASAIQRDGRTTHHLVTGPARDLVLAMSPRFQTASAVVGETTVTSYFVPGHADAGQAAVTFGARALTRFGEWFGTYPYRQFSIVEAPLGPGARGVEFPQLVFLNDDVYQSPADPRLAELDYLTAHEVAHQWFYGLVGNDQYQHAFLDEGLASTVAIAEVAAAGDSDAVAAGAAYLTTPYRNFLSAHADLVVDAPSESFPSSFAYNAIVYGKAVFGFDAIRVAIGPDAFNQALRLYVARFRFKVAQSSDLLACFNEASGVNVTHTWTRWFEKADESLETLPAPTPIGRAA